MAGIDLSVNRRAPVGPNTLTSLLLSKNPSLRQAVPLSPFAVAHFFSGEPLLMGLLLQPLLFGPAGVDGVGRLVGLPLAPLSRKPTFVAPHGLQDLSRPCPGKRKLHLLAEPGTVEPRVQVAQNELDSVPEAVFQRWVGRQPAQLPDKLRGANWRGLYDHASHGRGQPIPQPPSEVPRAAGRAVDLHAQVPRRGFDEILVQPTACREETHEAPPASADGRCAAPLTASARYKTSWAPSMCLSRFSNPAIG